MKKLLVLLFLLPLFASAQNLYWYDVLFDIPNENRASAEALINDYYSNIEIPSDVSVTLSRIPLKGNDFKGTHILNMFSSSSESLANFRGTLTGEKWNLYTSGLRGKIRSVRAVAGNALAYTNIDKVGPIGQVWLFKVHAKDNVKFVNAFNKLLKTMKPNGFLATGQFTHGTDDGESTFVYGTSEDLNEAFSGGPSNNKEAQALQTFFEEIHFAEYSQTFTRVLVKQY
jgi:hypothetical protein